MASGGEGGEGLDQALSLFPGGGGETVGLLEACPGLDGEEEDRALEALGARVQGWLRPYGGPLLGLQRLLVWERPLYSGSVALTLNTLFWLLSSTSLRPLFLLSVSLLGLMLLERWKHKLALITVQHEPEPSQAQREAGSVAPRLLSVPELSHHLADSYLTCCLYLQEMLQYKRQHHGKFCIMTCSGCAVLAVVGHYVPGIMISYIMALSVLLWPLVVYHELIQRMYTGLEPILMKLDYSMKGGAEHRKHDKRIIALLREVKKELESGDEPRAETESDSEEELSCFAPTVDAKTTALAMAITDSELSDEEASILESGGFSVSRATTPQLADLSEDLLDQQSLHSDPDESYLRDQPEFPSVEEFPSIDHSLFHFPLRAPPPQGPQADGGGGGAPGAQASSSDGEALSPASLLLLQHLASPLHFVNTHFNGHGRPPPGGDGGGAAALLGAVAEEEEEVGGEGGGGGASPVPHHRSLEALSEEIVSTAISTVVQNTLSALLRSSEEEEEEEEVEPSSLEQFLPTETASSPDRLLPTETRPGALETTVADHTTTTAAVPQDEPEPTVVAAETEAASSPDRLLPTETTPSLDPLLPTETTPSLDPLLPTETTVSLDRFLPTEAASSLDRFLPTETTPSPDRLLPTETTLSLDRLLPTETPPGGAPETTVAAQPADGEARRTATADAPGDEPEPTVVAAAAAEMPDDPLVAAEDEDFELLDQSELEQTDEGPGLGSGAQAFVVGGASGATDTPPSPQHQPEES